MANQELKNCPFCGAKAVVTVDQKKGKILDGYQIVGCSEMSMLCPNPSMIVYKKEDGSVDYKWWNKRV